ncbi:MAG: homoserine O-acetyltransferase [Candidatus Hydrogenedentota bacterium]
MTNNGSVGIVETQYFTFAQPPGKLELECGESLGPITLAYETYGALNADRSNAVLILHALSGDAHAAGYHSSSDDKPGWWDALIGPGRAFDTNKYFIICSNVLGGCGGSTGPSSINPETGRPYALSFPIITIGDMVRAQRRLVDHFGIDKLLSVTGGSMGGMQALEWITRYPERVDSAMLIATTPRQGAQAIAFDAVGRHAIQADPNFRDGEYYGDEPPRTGLAIARMLAHITYLSDQSMRMKFGRTLRTTNAYRYDFSSEFSVETYLDYQGAQFVNRFDANSYLYITKAIDYFDITAAAQSIDEAMANIGSKVMILSYSSDWLYPPYQSEQMVYALMRQEGDVTYCSIQSDYGHDAFLLEVGVMRKVVSGFLEHAMDPDKVRTPDQHAERIIDSETDPGPPSVHAKSIYEGHRVDYDMIVDLVDEESRVLDIGCGDGELLHKLISQKRVDGMGLELSQGNIISCVRRGISVVQADVDKGLTALPDKSYDYVILSMTLQVIRKPQLVLTEMLRVGKRCIVSIPNFGYWKVRAKVLAQGKAPVTRTLPYEWHMNPNRNYISINDFLEFCRTHNTAIENALYLSPRGATSPTKLWPNLLAEEAVFVLSSNEPPLLGETLDEG